MERFKLMDILEDIQIKNNKENIGSNEAELATREDIADLFFKLLAQAEEARKPEALPILDVSHSCFVNNYVAEKTEYISGSQYSNEYKGKMIPVIEFS